MGHSIFRALLKIFLHFVSIFLIVCRKNFVLSISISRNKPLNSVVFEKKAFKKKECLLNLGGTIPKSSVCIYKKSNFSKKAGFSYINNVFFPMFFNKGKYIFWKCVKTVLSWTIFLVLLTPAVIWTFFMEKRLYNIFWTTYPTEFIDLIWESSQSSTKESKNRKFSTTYIFFTDLSIFWLLLR